VVCASVIGNAVYQRIISGDSDLGTYAGVGLFSGVGYLLARIISNSINRGSSYVRASNSGASLSLGCS
jgi:hypothetical protein